MKHFFCALHWGVSWCIHITLNLVSTISLAPSWLLFSRLISGLNPFVYSWVIINVIGSNPRMITVHKQTVIHLSTTNWINPVESPNLLLLTLKILLHHLWVLSSQFPWYCNLCDIKFIVFPFEAAVHSMPSSENCVPLVPLVYHYISLWKRINRWINPTRFPNTLKYHIVEWAPRS